MAEPVPRKQTSFWMDADLLNDLRATAKRTHRTIRQLVEIILQQTLPLAESGFLDSSVGRELQLRFEEFSEREKTLQNPTDRKPRLQQKSNRPVAFRLDQEILTGIQKQSKRSQRSDRAVVELCLHFGIHLIEHHSALDPWLKSLVDAWANYAAAQPTAGSSKVRAKAASSLLKASGEFQGAFETAKTYGARTTTQLADALNADQATDDMEPIVSPLMDALDDWRRKRGWAKELPTRIVIESNLSGKWTVNLSEEASPLPSPKKPRKPAK